MIQKMLAVPGAAALVSLALGSAAYAADVLPTGGTVVAGAAQISQTNSAMVITQTTDRAALNWQSFSIGAGNSVTFNQPSSSSVALNRILGSDASAIYGALNANGHVFIVNPNGVLFSGSSQVNVGGLVASTRDISTSDFMNGNYTFDGTSGTSIVNHGAINAAHGGTVALIAAHIVNDGTIVADAGKVGMAAGERVTLDMGGPALLEVDRAALDALIEQGGVIRADGGLVYLTAKAANTLATTVINQTGEIEAQTLATGEKGAIYLLGDMDNDRITVGGKLDASAPNGGDGGFIETSAAKVAFASNPNITTKAAAGTNGHWLIDPEDFTIAASGGDITGADLATLLASNDITIHTATGSNNATDQFGTSGTDGNITVDDTVSWSDNKLTLDAYHNILVNQTLTATGTAELAFLYGQGTTDGAGSSYTVADDAHVYIPTATAFTWQKGSAANVTNLTFDNSLLRFGNDGDAALTAEGQLSSPFYFDNVTAGRNGWYQLTCCGVPNTYPLDIQVGVGGDGTIRTSGWNTNGQLLNSNDGTYGAAITDRSLDIAKYTEGTGTIVSSVTLTFPSSGPLVRVDNTYTLAADSQYLKTDTSVTNLGGSTVSNVRLWVGTRDDYIGTSDSNYKVKGNLDSSGFVAITDPNTQAKAVKVEESTDGVTGAAIMFYSTSSGADTSVNHCCSFTNVTSQDPRTSETTTPHAEDGSYALFDRFSDLATGQSDSLTWYYAAAPAAQINQAVQAVAESAGVPTAPPPATTTTETTTTPPPQIAAQQTAQTLSQTVTPNPVVSNTPNLGTLNVNTPSGGSISVGSLDIVELNSQPGSSGGNGGTTTNITSNSAPQGSGNGGSTTNLSSNGGQGDSQGGNTGDFALLSQVGADSSGLTRLFVVDGGVNIAGATGNDQK